MTNKEKDHSIPLWLKCLKACLALMSAKQKNPQEARSFPKTTGTILLKNQKCKLRKKIQKYGDRHYQ
ncbi:MAG: hypothetical protein F6K26_03430 [Moorea sp. SIO2I5]|nr:hypothetical protein [Moorena sp. SIO2I5]